ncbi:helix-turn-helix transcriptional regulator [Streptomyces sp. NPDC059649]|uniref:helix-turn-helix transcriptional regulator n=1 Tax=Streptomyces sp. NPDC059649 TaxID=3346895 RepID=UPI003673E07B
MRPAPVAALKVAGQPSEYDGDLNAQVTFDSWRCKAYFTPMRNEVRRLRAAPGLSQQALGAALGVSRQTVNAIEQDRYDPSLPLAIRIARYFGLT